MKFIVMKTGENLNDLAGRIATRAGAPAREQTLAALREANPRLVEFETRPATADTVVVLPRSVPLRPLDTRDQPSLPETLLDSVLARIDDAFAAVANVFAFEEQEAAAAVSRVRSAEIARLARTEPVLAQELAGVKQQATMRVERAKVARTAESTLARLIGEDVAALRKAVLDRSAIAGALAELEPLEAPQSQPLRRTTRKPPASTFTPLESVKGIGPATASRLRAAGIPNVETLLQTPGERLVEIAGFDAEVVRARAREAQQRAVAERAAQPSSEQPEAAPERAPRKRAARKRVKRGTRKRPADEQKD